MVDKGMYVIPYHAGHVIRPPPPSPSNYIN